MTKQLVLLITLIAALFVASSGVAQTHKLTRFLLNQQTYPVPTIEYGSDFGIAISYGMPGKFKLTFDPTANNSPHYQVSVASIVKDIVWHMESPDANAFDLILKRIMVVNGAVQLVAYDPDELITVSIDWIDE